jgi:polyhydroxyalkanoate synthesis regulator phasin
MAQEQEDKTRAGEQLRRVINPLDLVVITRARLQEAVDEAVQRGRITRGDAADLVTDLLARGRSQAEDLMTELEALLARAPIEAARRVAGLGPEFPITGYDDLTAAQVIAELEGMAPADLRRVREYERANANRKTVLSAIERKLDARR